MSSRSYINVIGAGLQFWSSSPKSQSVVFQLNFMKCVVSSQHPGKQTILLSWFTPILYVEMFLTNVRGFLRKKCVAWVQLYWICWSNPCSAGGALAADRDGFLPNGDPRVANHPLIEVVRDEITELLTDVITVSALVPLTSDALAEKICFNDLWWLISTDGQRSLFDANTIDKEQDTLGSNLVMTRE